MPIRPPHRYGDDPHPDLAPVAFLLGTWRGEGTGEYPTVARFGYAEEVRVGHVGGRFLTYAQRTWAPDTGLPMHAEVGYLRPGGPGRVELVVVQPSGITEVDEGTVVGTSITVSSRAVGHTSTAKEVTAVTRSFVLTGDSLTVSLSMAAVGHPLTGHLTAVLRRTN